MPYGTSSRFLDVPYGTSSSILDVRKSTLSLDVPYGSRCAIWHLGFSHVPYGTCRGPWGGFAFPLCFLDTLAWLNGFAVPKESLKALSARPGVSPGDFGVSSVLLRVSGCGFVPLFSLRPSGLPFPSPGVFPFGPFFGRVFLFFSFLPCSCILHLFSLG